MKLGALAVELEEALGRGHALELVEADFRRLAVVRRARGAVRAVDLDGRRGVRRRVDVGQVEPQHVAARVAELGRRGRDDDVDRLEARRLVRREDEGDLAAGPVVALRPDGVQVEERRAALFDGRIVTTWYRVAAFQASAGRRPCAPTPP